MTSTRRAEPRERPAARTRSEPAAPRRRFPGPAWLDGPMTSSQLVLGSAGMLLVIGLIMVFSASSIEAALADQPAWLPGVRQIVFAGIGLVLMLVALRLPVGRLRRWSGRGMLLVVVLLALVLVPGVGIKLNGSRAWFDLGFTNFQPSELAKLVFAVWGAHVIALRERYLTTRTLLVPVLPAFGLISVLLILEPDMGAVVSLGLVVAGLLWTGGLALRWIAAAVVLVAGAVGLMISAASYRMARITSFLDPCADAGDGGYQACRGLRALGTGGLWGVGLGNSATKWNGLPHAESDFIFAIIGEELGLLGCLVVVALYGILAYAGFRIARRSTDRFIQLASVAITVWLIGQATMNMGYVVGLLPVTGVQLPLISAGGTSLVLTLFIVGLLARFARSEPEAIAFQRARPPSRLTRLFLPVPTEAVAPLPSRRRRDSRPRRDGGGRDTRDDTRTGARTGVRVPAPAREEPGRRRSSGDGPLRAGEGRQGPAPRPRREPVPPVEQAARGDRQTVRGRPPAGDRVPLRDRPPSVAGPGTGAPRDRSAPADPPGGRGRPAPRSRTPRTERPGRLQ
ncbi:putative lipid II flippase FtsW [Modestobacter sp. URMC 112]